MAELLVKCEVDMRREKFDVSIRQQKAQILAHQMIQGDVSLNQVHLRAGECSFDIIRKELESVGRYRSMKGSVRAVILDDADQLKRSTMEKLRAYLEFQASPRLFIATCEKGRWSDALVSRFRVVRFKPITKVVATQFLKKVWHRLGRQGVAPALQQLQLSNSKHYNLREVLNHLESWIDTGGRVQAPASIRRPAPTRRIAAALIVALSCQRGQQFSTTVAFAELCQGGIEVFKSNVLSHFSSEIRLEDWISFTWPPTYQAFNRYAREGMKYLDDKGMYWAEGAYHFPHES